MNEHQVPVVHRIHPRACHQYFAMGADIDKVTEFEDILDLPVEKVRQAEPAE